MQELIKQEQFELEVLDKMKSAKLLDNLLFIGGTMLRLCYGLERFSVDLDFWLLRETNAKQLLAGLKTCLGKSYAVKDSADKFYTILLEIKSKGYPRSLKLEIRKKQAPVEPRQSIAYSKYSNLQVLVNTLSLEDAMKSKIETFLKRGEIRDAFDIEFLCRKGVKISETEETRGELLKRIGAFSKTDYTVKLGSLLEPGLRKYYAAENFKIIKNSLS
ncbi:MAG: hypothetical protein A2297_05980 [Elusimicrobia bacterium RIFOXYB2_FULL_48_7]|nr:MAG: hypothetical protein A2297_05980 [Elusimicrobia bacterium RIFOXYB2_FULL_48_7]